MGLSEVAQLVGRLATFFFLNVVPLPEEGTGIEERMT